MIKLFKNHYYLFGSIFIFFVVTFLAVGRWKNGMLSGGDPWGYYLYLPATFLYHDIDENLERTFNSRVKYNKGFVIDPSNPCPIPEAKNVQDSNKRVAKYTMGIAILLLPFFIIAHCSAYLLSFPLDGHSAPYLFWIQASTIAYTMLGLYLLRKLLMRYFSLTSVHLTLLLYAIATNLFYFTTMNNPMSHPYLFAIYAAILLLTDDWYKYKKNYSLFALAFLGGLATMIRPTEAIFVFIPMLYGVFSFKDLKARFAFIFDKWKIHLIAAIFAFIALLPQLLYWKMQTGHLFYYSYENESFDFKNPHIFQGIFGYRNGWLAYTPIMYLSLIGIYALYKYRNPFRWPLFIFLPIHIYIIYSWWCWYYINGFGSRPMIEAMPILSLPFTAFFDNLASAQKYKYAKRAITTIFILFCVWANLLNTYQSIHGMFITEWGNSGFYWNVINKWKYNYEDVVTFDNGEIQPDSNKLNVVRTLYENSFEEAQDSHYISKEKYTGNYSYKLERGLKTPIYNVAIKDLQDAEAGDYIKMEAWCKAEFGNWDLLKMSFFELAFIQKEHNIHTRYMRIENKLRQDNWLIYGGGDNSRWYKLVYYVKIPRYFRDADTFTACVWSNDGNTPIFIDDMKVQLCKVK